MKYPEELKKKIRSVYGNFFDKQIEAGRDSLGRYLDDYSAGGFSVDDILKATSLDDLKAEARSKQLKREVWHEWSSEFERQWKIHENSKL